MGDISSYIILSKGAFKIMTVVAAIFVPIVIAYKIWVYRVFRSKVSVKDVMENREAY